MKLKTILLTGTSGFIGNIFLKFILSKNFKVIDVLRNKNKKNKSLNQLRKKYRDTYETIFFNNEFLLNKKFG